MKCTIENVNRLLSAMRGNGKNHIDKRDQEIFYYGYLEAIKEISFTVNTQWKD